MAGITAIGVLVLMIVQFVGTIAYLFLIASLFSRLKASHASQWESLGSPSLFRNNTLRNNWQLLGWLWGKRYSNLVDPETISLAQTVRTLQLVLFANFAILILLAVLFAILQSHVPMSH